MTRPLEELVARTPSGQLGRLRADEEPSALPSHPGLWLDRVIASESNGGDGAGSQGHPERRRLYEIAVEALRLTPRSETDPPALQAYRVLFDRWRRWIERPAPGLVRRSVAVRTRSRMLLHPATNATVTEGSVLLHHTYGVPYLPGSGLKGVLRRRLEAADRAASDGGDGLADQILGREPKKGDLASAIDLLDALWIPDRSPEGSTSPLALDVVTPHHPSYYTASAAGRQLPTDFDEPVPVERLTVAPGTSFLVVVEGPDSEHAADWLTAVLDRALLPALDEQGFGAWTSVGYGRLRPVDAAGSGNDRTTSSDAETAETFIALVVRNPGTGELEAALGDGRRAAATRSETEALLASLPEPYIKSLRGKKKQARLEIDVEPRGLAWRITALRPEGD